jgi:hypothetical protein
MSKGAHRSLLSQQRNPSSRGATGPARCSDRPVSLVSARDIQSRSRLIVSPGSRTVTFRTRNRSFLDQPGGPVHDQPACLPVPGRRGPASGGISRTGRPGCFCLRNVRPAGSRGRGDCQRRARHLGGSGQFSPQASPQGVPGRILLGLGIACQLLGHRPGRATAGDPPARQLDLPRPARPGDLVDDLYSRSQAGRPSWIVRDHDRLQSADRDQRAQAG